MTPLEQRKLKYLRERFGDMTAEEALSLAESAEQHYTDTPVYDTHMRVHTWQEREDLLKYVALLDAEAL